MELVFIGLLLGAVLSFIIFNRFSNYKKKTLLQSQSTVLIEKIKNVCKLITVEGDFAEIYHYESVKERFFNILSGKKKALILIDAKAHVGFDLTQVQIQSDPKNKKIILSHFPKARLLSVETDFKYYDKKEGWLNPITSSDLTEINKEAKQFIKDKIPDSGLMESAHRELLSAIGLMQSVAEAIGWQLDYTALELTKSDKKKLIDS